MLDKNGNEIFSQQSIGSLIINGYKIFGKYVNEARHLPHLRDGLKPVYRRLIQTAYECAANRKIKTATVAGECFVGDTEVLDVRENKVKIEDLAKRDLDKDPFYVYSMSTEGILEISRVIRAWSNGIKNNLVKVTLDNGKSFTSTTDHKIMMRDGTYVEAGKLNIGDNLMSIKSRKVTSIEFINENREVFDLEVNSDLHNFSLGCGIIVHNCMAFYHPHGDASDVVAELVHMGILEGQGSFGRTLLTGDVLRAASPRYTEVKLNPVIKSQLDKLLPYVPKTPAYSYGHEEYEYIPTPIPMMLISSTLGIGFGISAMVPAFTIGSLYEAYLANDFTKLVPNYGYEIDLNDKSNYKGLKSLWEKGSGAITYKIPVKESHVEGDFGFIVECDNPLIFTPDLKKLREWESYGWVNIMDLSDTKSQLFISKVKRCRSITDEDIRNELAVACSSKRGYFCNIYDGKIAGLVGMYDWIDYTFKQYKAIYQDYIDDNLKKLLFEKVMWRDFSRASQLIVETAKDKKTPKYSYEEIIKIINDENLNKKDEKFRKEYKEFTLEHLNVIGRKSLNTLRTVDPQLKLSEVEKLIEEFVNLDIDKEIKAYVDSYPELK